MHAAACFEDAPGDGATKDAGNGGRGGHGKERDGADAADGARVEAERALDCLPLMARTALTRGRALLHPALTKMTETGEMPATELMDEALRAFKLAQLLDPESEEAKGEVEA